MRIFLLVLSVLVASGAIEARASTTYPVTAGRSGPNLYAVAGIGNWVVQTAPCPVLALSDSATLVVDSPTSGEITFSSGLSCDIVAVYGLYGAPAANFADELTYQGESFFTAASLGLLVRASSACSVASSGPGVISVATAGPGYRVGVPFGTISFGGILTCDLIAIYQRLDLYGNVLATVPGQLSGLWWNSGESGWGIDFTQRGDNVFAAWYTYDAAGNPKWYVAPNCAGVSAGSTNGTCTGTLYEVNGPRFFGVAFTAITREQVTAAGSLQVQFADANDATMTFTVGDTSRTVPIARQVFAPASSAPPPVDYTDLWWNPNEAGWGMNITHQADNIVMLWYVYDDNGNPVWYVAPNCTVAGNACSGTLYSTTGPAFGPTFDASKVHATVVGTVSLEFTDANNAALSYMVNGVSGSKNVTRQLF